MHAEVFTDGIDEITVGGAIVRVDLVSLSPTERDSNNLPKKIFRQRLIFSVEAFANSAEVMLSALQGLVDAGVVRRNQPLEQAVNLGDDPAVPNTSRAPNVSANFR